ncbi:NAD(P)-binding protein [Nostocoides veronense]|uniref:RCK N-terminal domain-containing protein n=1 Tax=Nostocoides veronense TaxID=330836 RepID=A0ABN2LD06_9MICO
MVNPLLLVRPRRRRSTDLRQNHVAIPSAAPGSDAIFLLLRRMRMPLVVLVGVFTVSVFGLAAMPGTDADGNPARIGVFEAFYVMSYTATTIGFGEIPYPFSIQQRLWVTGCIYATVIAWAYAIGMVLALSQDEGFRDAVAAQRFGRKVRHQNEKFHIIAGYGGAGHRVGNALDLIRSRFVVIDSDGLRIDRLATEQLSSEVPGVQGDAAAPAVLGLAGLGHKHCVGVLALAGDDLTNLGVVQAVHLLRPELPVIAWARDRELAEHMREFGATAVVNPYDRFGAYLAIGLRRPVTLQLMHWLMSPLGSPVPETAHAVPDGTWLVCAEGAFKAEIERDLRGAGYNVVHRDPSDGIGDCRDYVGFVAGADHDTVNLALGAEVRRQSPSIFLCLRQSKAASAPLYDAFAPDSIFLATELVARECYSRIVTPRMWKFLEFCGEQDEDWSQAFLDHLLDRCGPGSPNGWRLSIDEAGAPGLVRWLAHDPMTIGQLLRNPADRESFAPVVALAHKRGSEVTPTPDEDTPLRVGDELLLASPARGYAFLHETLFNEAVAEYVATGRAVPTTWLWRRLTRTRSRRPASTA